MSVFKITKKSVERITPVKPTSEENDPAQVAGPTDTPVENTNDTQEAKTVVEGDNAQVVESPASQPEMMVSVEGPVGKVFTDALNKMLATENYMTMISPDATIEETPQKQDTAKSAMRVYCWSGDAVNLEDVVKLTNDISRHTEHDFIVAVENVRSASRNLGLLEDLAKTSKLKICYGQESALNYIKGKLS